LDGGLGGEGVLSGFHPLPLNPTWQWERIALLAIVRFLCSFPHTNTAPDQTKRAIGPYKRRISYHVCGGDGRDGRDGEPAPQRTAAAATTATSESPISAQPPHPTRVGTTFSLGEALA